MTTTHGTHAPSRSPEGAATDFQTAMAAASESSNALATRRRAEAENLASVAFWPVLAIAPTSVALVVEAALGRRARSAAVLAGLGTALGLGLFRWQMARLFAQEPAYVVERRIGSFELRQYPAGVRAETTVESRPWREALDEGFRRLADYIFTGNEASERISMTAPVTTFRDRAEATSAILAEENEGGPPSNDDADLDAIATGDDLVVAFMMPAGRALRSLPCPSDTRVKLVEGAPRRVAVLRFAGSFDAELTRRKQLELYEATQRAGLTAVSDPGFAGYDPPTTLPFLRRNEVWIEVENDAI